MWPMPLPFPGALLETCLDSNTRALRGLNLCVAALDWVFLNRPSTCPLEIVIPAKLSRLQWRVVRCMEGAVLAWIKCSPIDSTAMGRSAAKVEDIEKALHKLSVFEGQVFSVFQEVFADNSGLGSVRRPISKMAPGLQRVSPGVVCGVLQGEDMQVARPIVASRIDFRGEPSFDPSPFLDARARKIFNCPIKAALSPEEAPEAPPAVKIFASEAEKWALLRKLDSTGRLGVFRLRQAYPGYQAGLFAVAKDIEKDRLIFDSRPFNCLEQPPNKWISSMGASSCLLELQMSPGERMLLSGTDLREFYYSFSATQERVIRNSLIGPVYAQDIRDFRCYDASLEGAGPLLFGLKTLAMGDSCAVEIAQTAHLGILVQCGLVDESTLVSMTLPPPRSPSMLGVVIDDLILFELVARGVSVSDPSVKTGKMLDKALESYERLGLIAHPGKTFRLEEEAEFWGSHLDGVSGAVRANLKRVVPLVFATVGVIKLGICTLSLLNVLVGSWTSVFLYKRRMLSLINVSYAALHSSEDPRAVLRLSDELLSELILIVSLAPLAVTFLTAENSNFVFASDASSWGLAVCKAPLPLWLRGEIHRHKLRKSTWVKLLSPSKALDRLHGELQASDELPSGEVLCSHPLHSLLITGLQFEEVCRARTRDGSDINIGELRAMTRSEYEAALIGFPNRTMYLGDSQVALGCWIKGRSSSYGLNQVLQQSLPVHLGCGLISNGGYVPTDVNVADDPTRGKAIRPPACELPSWMPDCTELSVADRCCQLDEFLVSLGADSFELSGLPPFEELRTVESFPLLPSRSLRSKSYFAQKRAVKTARKSQSPQAFPKEVGRAKFAFPSPSPLSDFSWPEEAVSLLSRLDAAQFIFPKSWSVPSSWRPCESLPQCKGYLDLYSGQKGVARAIVEEAAVWSLTFEIEDGEAQNLADSELRVLIGRLIQLGVFFALGAAIFCRSFSRAVRPPIRSRVSPRGLDHLTARMQKSVSDGNDHSDWLASLIGLALALGLLFWVENPDGSFLWLQDAWIKLGCQLPSHVFRLDYCRCNCPWRKRTRFLTNCHLKGQTMFCLLDHVHRRLVGWSKVHRACWTRVAQTYPKLLCKWIALALLIDAGLRPDRRCLNLASISGQSGRIGEAANPGPRKSRQHSRDVRLLDNATLVEPGTELIGTRIWDRFRAWCLRFLSISTFDQLALCPQTLVELLDAFGRELFSEGASLYLFRHLLAAVQRWQPDFRPFMGRAWQLVVRWESLEPTVHRTPLPLVLFRAMVAVASLWGWHRFLGMLLFYFGICRPGEPLNATRFDLLLPRDLIYESSDVCFLCIRRPKSRRRGLGVIQHSKISSAEVVAALDFIFSGLHAGEPLYAGSPSSFRRRWDAILAALGVPKTIGLTPASMCAGGAITAYRADEDIMKILWRMRLKSLQTFSHYLQEVGALSVFGELPFDCRLRIERAAELYSFLLPGPSFLAAPSST